MKNRTGILRRLVSLILTMSVVLSIGTAVHGDDEASHYYGEFRISTEYGNNDGYQWPDFYFTITPSMSGERYFWTRRFSSAYYDGKVIVYDSFDPSTGAGHIVDQWTVTNTTYDESSRHTVLLTSNTTYYIRYLCARENSRTQLVLYYDAEDVTDKWCNLHLWPNDGTETQDLQLDIVQGYASRLPSQPFTDSTGARTIAGWAYSSGGNIVCDDGGLFTPGVGQTQIDLWAVWGNTLSFNNNGGSGENMPNVGVITGEYYSLPECSWTSDSGSFICWCTTADGTGTRYNPGDAITIDEATTLYAIYSEYMPMYQLKADSNRLYLNVYVPYVDGAVLTVKLDGVVQQLGTDASYPNYGTFTISSVARCMTDTHNLVVSKADGTVLYSGSISVRNYLRAVINSSSTSNNVKNAAIAMLRYGAAAQLYFNYPAGITEGDPRIANYGVEGAELSTLSTVSIPEIANLERIQSYFHLLCSQYYGMNLTFTDDMTFMIAFRITRTADEAIAELSRENFYFENELHPDYSVDGSGQYVIVRINIPLRGIARDVTHTSSHICLSDYLHRVVQDENVREEYRDLCLALYGFYEAAAEM